MHLLYVGSYGRVNANIKNFNYGEVQDWDIRGGDNVIVSYLHLHANSIDGLQYANIFVVFLEGVSSRPYLIQQKNSYNFHHHSNLMRSSMPTKLEPILNRQHPHSSISLIF